MAKTPSKTSKKDDDDEKGDQPERSGMEIETLDERDTKEKAERRAAAKDVLRSALPGASSQLEREVREEYVRERQAAAQREYEEAEVPEEVSGPNLPINHPTLIGPDDRVPPPEATPREGKTAGSMPLSVPALTPKQLAAREAAEPEMPVMVEAIALGYYDLIRRRPGDVFYIKSPKAFSARWMRPAPPNAQPGPVTLSNEAIRRAHDATLAAKMGMGTTTNRGVTEGLDQSEEDNPFKEAR
jgi:hypothetical protein